MVSPLGTSVRGENKLSRVDAVKRVKQAPIIAELAYKQGWLHGLIDFVEEHGEFPGRYQQTEMHRKALRIAENIEFFRTQAFDPLKPRFYPALAKMRRAMLADGERLIYGKSSLPLPPVEAPPSNLREKQQREAITKLKELELKNQNAALPKLSDEALKIVNKQKPDENINDEALM
jgi:hypothetical protein